VLYIFCKTHPGEYDVSTEHRNISCVMYLHGMHFYILLPFVLLIRRFNSCTINIPSSVSNLNTKEWQLNLTFDDNITINSLQVNLKLDALLTLRRIAVMFFLDKLLNYILYPTPSLSSLLERIFIFMYLSTTSDHVLHSK